MYRFKGYLAVTPDSSRGRASYLAVTPDSSRERARYLVGADRFDKELFLARRHLEASQAHVDVPRGVPPHDEVHAAGVHHCLIEAF